MELGVLFSGGKDSTLALYRAMQDGHVIKTLITIISHNPESYMYHVPNIGLTRLQAQAMELPIIYRTTAGEKEKELADLKDAVEEAIDKYKISGIVSGAIFSNYQKNRIDTICRDLGLVSLTPLWKQRPRDLLVEMVDSGFHIIISAVAAGGLGQEWLGREINLTTIEELCNLHDTYYVCIGGEGGEFETLVLDAPFYTKRIEIVDADILWDGQSGVYKVKEAVLV